MNDCYSSVILTRLGKHSKHTLEVNVSLIIEIQQPKLCKHKSQNTIELTNKIQTNILNKSNEDANKKDDLVDSNLAITPKNDLKTIFKQCIQ